MLRIRTLRLDLIAATLAHLDAELESNAKLASLVDADVPAGWPPGEYDRPAIEFFRARISENPEAVGWFGWYAILRSTPGQPATVIGAGGYFGPPSTEGTVEIGYSIVPEYRDCGFATELVGALILRAFESPGVTRVIAHTNADNLGSVGVLKKSGFTFAGPGQESSTVRYILAKPSEKSSS